MSDPEKTTAWGSPLETRTPYVEAWLGDFGVFLNDYSVPASIMLAIPVMIVIGNELAR